MRAAIPARLACGLLALLGLAPPAMAGDAPKWLHAQVGVALPAHDEKTSALLLYSETILTVESNGKIKRLRRKAYRILRPDGQERGTVRVDFDSQSRVIGLHGWCIPATGKDYEVKQRDAVETSLSGVEDGELVSDERTLLLRIPAATPGSIVGYEVEQEQRPYVLTDDWQFQETVPSREEHYTLQLPSGWSYKTTWLNHGDESPVAGGAGQWQWTVNDVRAIRVESHMPPWRGIAGRMFVALLPPNGQGSGIQTWRDMGVWQGNLARDRRDASPALRDKVAELTASEPKLLGKMQALARFVQNNIRYVAIELGIGGFQPHPAGDVFVHRYGDCKDKATLLSTMLREIGVTSYYVIINTERGSVTATTPPNLEFNHVILAIALPGDLSDASLAARTPNATVGQILFFDPTDTFTPLGGLRGELQGNYGLLVTPDGGDLVALPQLPTNSNGVERTAKLTLDDKGTLRGDVHEVRLGDRAAIQRNALRASTLDTDRIKPVEALLGGSLSSFQIVKAAIANLQATDKPFEWHYSLESADYAKTAGELLLVRPRVFGTHASGFLETREPREHTVEFEGPERDTDVFEITLPPGYEVDELPSAVDVDDGFAAYRSKTEVVGRILRYTRSFEVKGLSVPIGKTDVLKLLYRTIENDERNLAVLRRVKS